jgi:hypothetical protein
MSPGKESENKISLEGALALAESAMWRERELAARVFACYATDQSAFNALVNMLDDPDTAVIEASTESLTSGGGERGFSCVLKKLALSDENVGYHIRDKLVALWLDGVPVLEMCRDIVSRRENDSLAQAAMGLIQELANN